MATPATVARLLQTVNADQLYTSFTQVRLEQTGSHEMEQDHLEGVANVLYHATVFEMLRPQMVACIESFLAEQFIDAEIDELTLAAQLSSVQKLLASLTALQEALHLRMYDSGLMDPNNVAD